MDIFGTANEIKNLDDQQLMQVRSRIPDFLFAAEMSRRDQMRKAYQADVANKKGKSTVMDDMEQRMQQQMQPQQPMQPQGPPQQQQPPMMQQAPPQQEGVSQMMAGGGMVRYKDGGSAGPWREGYGAGAPAAAAMPMPAVLRAPRTREEWLAKFGDVPSIAQYKSQAQDLMGGQDYLGPIAAEMADRKAKAVVGKPSGWQALMRAGLAMAASRRPDAMGGIAEGLMAGLDGYSRDREAYRGDQVRQESVAAQLLQQKAAMAQHQQAQATQQAQLAAQLQATQGHRDNTITGGIMNVLTQDEGNAARFSLEKMRDDAQEKLNGPLRQAQMEKYRQGAEDAKARRAEIEKYGGEIKADIFRRNATREPHVYSAMDQMRAGIIAEMRAAGKSFREINDYFDHNDERLENALKIQRERLVAQDMAAMAKDPLFALATPEAKQKAQSESFLRHSQNLGLAIPGVDSQQIPPPVGAWDPKRKSISALEPKINTSIGGKGHTSPLDKSGSSQEWRKSLELKPEGAISATDIYRMFGK